jgi:hypothetical protein
MPLWLERYSFAPTIFPCHVIEDTDKHIFNLVCQYLYTADYSITVPGDTPPHGLGTSGGREKAAQAHVLVIEGSIF